MFASTLLQPVTRQYIYDQLLSQYRLQNARNTSESRQNRSCSGRENIEHDKLFEEVFDWFIYLELTLAMSALLTTPSLGSWSDRIGRKVAFLVPSFGAILQAAVYAVVFNFKLEFRLLFIGNFLCGIAGYTTAFNAACLAYVSDITSKSQRTSRVAVMNTAFGVGTGLAGFISIYLLEFDSHLNSIWVILALKLGIAVYVLSFLKETISRNTSQPFQCKNLFNMFGMFGLELAGMSAGGGWSLMHSHSRCLRLLSQGRTSSSSIMLFHGQCASHILKLDIWLQHWVSTTSQASPEYTLCNCFPSSLITGSYWLDSCLLLVVCWWQHLQSLHSYSSSVSADNAPGRRGKDSHERVGMLAGNVCFDP